MQMAMFVFISFGWGACEGHCVRRVSSFLLRHFVLILACVDA